MDTSVHAHIVAQHIQDRIATATGERRALEVRAQSKPRRRAPRIHLPRRRAVVPARPLAR